MSIEENKDTFRRYVEEAVSQGKMELLDEIFDTYIAHQPDGSMLERGPEDVRRFQSEFRKAFPDFHVTIEDQSPRHPQARRLPRPLAGVRACTLSAGAEALSTFVARYVGVGNTPDVRVKIEEGEDHGSG